MRKNNSNSLRDESTSWSAAVLCEAGPWCPVVRERSVFLSSRGDSGDLLGRLGGREECVRTTSNDDFGDSNGGFGCLYNDITELMIQNSFHHQDPAWCSREANSLCGMTVRCYGIRKEVIEYEDKLWINLVHSLYNPSTCLLRPSTSTLHPWPTGVQVDGAPPAPV